MTAGDVQVRIDDRARLLGALLAATRYPEMAQARRKHGVHAHARATRKRVAPLTAHPAALAVDVLLAQEMPVEALFALMFALDPITLRPAMMFADLPPALGEGLADFALQAGLADWWREEAESWSQSAAEAERALTGAALGPFLDGIFGPTTARLTFMPNIGLPADEEIALAAEGELIAIVPPRLAWGDSPPWPFDEDPAHVLRAAIVAYSRLRLADALRARPELFAQAAASDLSVSDKFRALYPAGPEQFAQVFSGALVAIYLEEHVSPQEASAYLLMEKRLRGLEVLPAAVSVLRDYRGGRKAGSAAALKGLLLTFADRLRAALG